MQEDEEKRGEHTTISQGVVNKHFIRSGGNGSMNFISAKILEKEEGNKINKNRG